MYVILLGRSSDLGIKCVLIAFLTGTAGHSALQPKSHFVMIKMENVRGRLKRAEHEVDLLVLPKVFHLSSTTKRVDRSATGHWDIFFLKVLFPTETGWLALKCLNV